MPRPATRSARGNLPGLLALAALIPLLAVVGLTVAGRWSAFGSDSVQPVTVTLNPGLRADLAANPPSGPDQAQLLLTATNDSRAAAGCQPLRMDSRLRTAAQGHAEDMVVEHYFDHVSPSGVTPGERADRAGYRGEVGENIAVGFTSVDAVLASWLASPAHRANILNCRYSVIGIGYDAGTVQPRWGPGTWVQLFGSG